MPLSSRTLLVFAGGVPGEGEVRDTDRETMALLQAGSWIRASREVVGETKSDLEAAKAAVPEQFQNGDYSRQSSAR